MSNSKVSVKDKLYSVKLYLDGKKSQHQIADVYGVKLSSVQQWIRNYESLGANAFTQKEYRKYSKELKEQAVLDYLAGQGSQDDICKKYGIRSKSKLQKWIKVYNGHGELKSSGTGGNKIMTKGRKTAQKKYSRQTESFSQFQLLLFQATQIVRAVLVCFPYCCTFSLMFLLN